MAGCGRASYDSAMSHTSGYVVHGTDRYRLGDEPLTFGRSKRCGITITQDDLGISRFAGSVVIEDDGIWVANTSDAKHFVVVDNLGFRHAVAPGQRHAVVDGPAEVVVEGSVERHALVVSFDTPTPPAPAVRLGRSEPSTVLFADLAAKDRLALVALFRGYLQPFPRHDPHPTTYAAAAELLGWKRSTVVKRVEHIRDRLTAAGVPNLVGENALAYLAEFVIANRLVTRADLDLLPPRRR